MKLIKCLVLGMLVVGGCAASTGFDKAHINGLVNVVNRSALLDGAKNANPKLTEWKLIVDRASKSLEDLKEALNGGNSAKIAKANENVEYAFAYVDRMHYYAVIEIHRVDRFLLSTETNLAKYGRQDDPKWVEKRTAFLQCIKEMKSAVLDKDPKAIVPVFEKYENAGNEMRDVYVSIIDEEEAKKKAKAK